jgi:DNA-binding MarR family transcriptional regulator
MTNRIDKLERRGWVERVTGKQDRRNVAVRLTAKGKRITERAAHDRFELASKNVSNLSAKEQCKLYELLRKINPK